MVRPDRYRCGRYEAIYIGISDGWEASTWSCCQGARRSAVRALPVSGPIVAFSTTGCTQSYVCLNGRSLIIVSISLLSKHTAGEEDCSGTSVYNHTVIPFRLPSSYSARNLPSILA